MLFAIYTMPKSTDRLWNGLRVGTICDAIEWDYTKRFCGAGTFSLTIPRTSLGAPQIEVGCMLALVNKDEPDNSDKKYEGFIVKDILRKNDTIKITGYDLNGLLIDRITLAETEDGKDAQSGATETIVKHYVAANCAESADADRNFPGFETAPDRGRGLVNDAASPRLSRVSDVVNDILGAAGMGYRIYPDFRRVDKPAIVFEVYEEVNRTDEQSTNPRVIFSYGHKNIAEMTRETGVTADRNTFYCEYNGGYVTRYDKNDKKSAEQAAKYSGYGRREEYLELSCELAEVEVYAEHEIADRYRETDSLEIVAGNPLDYGRVYNVGDIATVYDRGRKVKLNSVISAVEIKKTATEYSVNITLGDAKPKPLDLIGKSGGAVATVIRQDVSVISSRVTSYEYLSDVSVKYNGIIYTVEKNENGLISKISDDTGNSFKPTISGEITDIPLHNAVFWAVVMHGGLAKNPELVFDYTGIVGMFIPETLSLSEGLWKDARGGAAITLTGGSAIENGVRFQAGEYGSYTVSEPNTVYAIARAQPVSGGVWSPLITKQQPANNINYGFDLFNFGGVLTFSGIGDDRSTVSNISVADYHVICYTRNGADVLFYIDDVLIGTRPTVYEGKYSENMLLNRCLRGGGAANTTSGTSDFIMCAFGLEYHTPEVVVNNTKYLAKTYLGGT